MQINKIIVSCLLASIGCANFAQCEKVDFDLSMDKQNYPQVFEQKIAAPMYNFFKKFFNTHFVYQVDEAAQIKIPTLFHYIWLGGAVPEEYAHFRESWFVYHPDWIFIFWTDSPANYDFGECVLTSFDEVEQLLADKPAPGTRIVVDVNNLKFKNNVFFNKAQNFGERSDILKWEVVYRFGGVYIDVDFESLRSLDQLNYQYDFYTALQPLDTGGVQLGAALFAACPHHPILKACVEGIKNNQHIPQVVIKTGPLHFTVSLLNSINDGEGEFINQVFPASYFYPCSYEQRGMAQEVWRKPESYAIHHWAGSWLKPEGWAKE